MLALLFFFALAATTSVMSEDKPAPRCEAVTHAHRSRDIRVAAIEVTDADSCGVSFVDLEAQLVGRYQLAKEFRVVEMGADGRTVERPISALKKGKRGTLVYCERCRAAVGFRIEE